MIEQKKDTGIVNIHGKEYQTVALRVKMMLEEHPEWHFETDLIHTNNGNLIVKAYIKDADGKIHSTGHAMETVGSNMINKTSALECAETSAIGRALAFIGYLGSEIASADELANALRLQNGQG